MWGQPLSHRMDLRGRIPSAAKPLLDLGTTGLCQALMRRLGEGELDPEIAAACVPRLWWRAAPRPLEVRNEGLPLGEAGWRRLWLATPYTDDGDQRRRPTRPVRIYRGGSSRGWSWTDDVRIAQLFASDFGSRSPEGRLWTAEAQPDAICAWVPAGIDERTGRSAADECIIDPDRLGTVEPWTSERPSDSWVTADGRLHVRL